MIILHKINTFQHKSSIFKLSFKDCKNKNTTKVKIKPTNKFFS